MKAHFGHITYDVEIVGELDHHDDENREGPYGYSDHPTRQIKVVHQGGHHEEYAANTLLHELMHAAADVVGFHPENEEEVVHALTAGLMLLLRDSRNAPLVALLTGEDSEHERPADEPAVGEQVTDSDDDVWQRFEGGWRWWADGADGGWTPRLRTWDYVQNYGPVRTTTDDDRRCVGLPVRDAPGVDRRSTDRKDRR